MNCPKCGSEKVWAQKKINYKDGSKGQVFQCGDCRKYFTIKQNDSTQIKEVGSIDHVPKRLGVSIEEIIRTHDVDELIKQGLKKLEKGTLLTEQEFVDICNLRGKPYRSFIESPEMKIYKGKIDGTYYYGVPTDIEILRQKFIMR